MGASRSEALARRRATYRDVLDAPPHRVAEIVEGALYTRPRPAMPHALASSSLGTDLANPFQFGRGLAAAGRAGGGSSTSRSCISATTSLSRLSRDGAAIGCRSTPTPRT